MKNIINSVFRYLLIPFVVIGWAITRCFVGGTFGEAGVAMGTIAAMGGFGLLVFFPMNSFIIQIIPGTIVILIDVIVIILISIGLIRGASYASRDVNYGNTIHSHFIDPINIQNIITTLFKYIISGLSLYLFLKLLDELGFF